jgi:hypothetical protein
VSITFPKIASSNSAVIIKGDKINVEEAKRKIEEIVKDLVSIYYTNIFINSYWNY